MVMKLMRSRIKNNLLLLPLLRVGCGSLLINLIRALLPLVTLAQVPYARFLTVR